MSLYLVSEGVDHGKRLRNGDLDVDGILITISCHFLTLPNERREHYSRKSTEICLKDFSSKNGITTAIYVQKLIIHPFEKLSRDDWKIALGGSVTLPYLQTPIITNC